MYRRRRDVDLSASRHRLAPLAQAVTRTQDRQEAHPRPLICFSPGSSSSDDQMVLVKMMMMLTIMLMVILRTKQHPDSLNSGRCDHDHGGKIMIMRDEKNFSIKRKFLKEN